MDVYSTDELIDVVRSLKRVQRFLTSLWFPNVRQSTASTVHVDVEKHKRRMAPFVHPRSQAKVVESEGYQTNSIRPAYVKPKNAYDPEQAIDQRSIGEALTGNLSPSEREARWVAQTLADHQEQIDRRLEWMAVQACLSGTVTITGEGFDAIVVNFGRAAGHTETLAGAARWGEAGIRPLKDLQDRGKIVQKASGAFPSTVVMEPEAFDEFVQDTEVQRLLDTRRGSASLLEMAPGGIEPMFQGSIGVFDIWTYQDWYVDDAGVEQELLPAHQVLMGTSAIEGRQHYGAIRDRKAGYAALPFFPKMWEDEDPSELYLMSQSAPLVAPLRPDASFALKVR